MKIDLHPKARAARLGSGFWTPVQTPDERERLYERPIPDSWGKRPFRDVQARGTPPAVSSGVTVSPTCRVLFVDDEETILFALQDYFRAEGYEVDAARDVAKAHTLLAERAYAVVVIDLSLGPGQDMLGLELVSFVRERHPRTAVVLFTAYGTPEVECEVRRRGAVLLEKPLPLTEIGTAIEWLRHPSGGSVTCPTCRQQNAQGPDA